MDGPGEQWEAVATWGSYMDLQGLLPGIGHGAHQESYVMCGERQSRA